MNDSTLGVVTHTGETLNKSEVRTSLGMATGVDILPSESNAKSTKSTFRHSSRDAVPGMSDGPAVYPGHTGIINSSTLGENVHGSCYVSSDRSQTSQSFY